MGRSIFILTQWHHTPDDFVLSMATLIWLARLVWGNPGRILSERTEKMFCGGSHICAYWVQIYRPCMESQTSEINCEWESWHMYLVSLGNTKCMIQWAVPTLSGKCQFIVQCLPHHCEFWLVLIFECVKYFAWSLLWWFCDFSVIQFVNKLVQLKAPTWCWRSTCQKQYFNRFIIRESFNYKCIKTYWCEWAE